MLRGLRWDIVAAGPTDVHNLFPDTMYLCHCSLEMSAVAECLRLLSIGAHFPSPEVLLPADDITAHEYLLTLRVF